MLDAIIIGAGAAGLAAGSKFHEAKVRFQILEARNRLGGRAYTVGDGIPIELGPEFIHGKAEITAQIMKSFHLPAVDVPDHHFVLRGKRRVDANHFWDTLAKTLKKIPKLKKDVSMEKAILLTKGVSSEDKALVTSFVQGFDASLIGEVSAKEMLGTLNQVEDPEERKVGRTIDGYSKLLSAIATPFYDQIQFQSEVQKVEWKKNCVLVSFTQGKAGNLRTILAKKLLVTVPVGVLKLESGSQGSIHFDPPLYEKAQALAGLEMGPVVKIVLHFKRDFWSEKWGQPISMIHTPTKKFQTWWGPNPLRRPIFTAWSGGDPSLIVSSMKKKAREELVLKEFADVIGRPIVLVKRELEKIYYHDWDEDPYSRGAYSFVCTGGSGARESLAKPIDQTLFFAGEATSSEHNGTIEGGFETGIRAAKQILKRR